MSAWYKPLEFILKDSHLPSFIIALVPGSSRQAQTRALGSSTTVDQTGTVWGRGPCRGVGSVSGNLKLEKSVSGFPPPRFCGFFLEEPRSALGSSLSPTLSPIWPPSLEAQFVFGRIAVDPLDRRVLLSGSFLGFLKSHQVCLL